jgi:hypothetical protein
MYINPKNKRVLSQNGFNSVGTPEGRNCSTFHLLNLQRLIFDSLSRIFVMLTFGR